MFYVRLITLNLSLLYYLNTKSQILGRVTQLVYRANYTFAHAPLRRTSLRRRRRSVGQRDKGCDRWESR